MAEGKKHDQGKLRFLEAPLARREVAAVRHFGAVVYGDENWRKVPDLETRYWDALQRHLLDYAMGKQWDHESGLHVLAHASACVQFLLENAIAKHVNATGDDFQQRLAEALHRADMKCALVEMAQAIKDKR